MLSRFRRTIGASSTMLGVGRSKYSLVGIAMVASSYGRSGQLHMEPPPLCRVFIQLAVEGIARVDDEPHQRGHQESDGVYDEKPVPSDGGENQRPNDRLKGVAHVADGV